MAFRSVWDPGDILKAGKQSRGDKVAIFVRCCRWAFGFVIVIEEKFVLIVFIIVVVVILLGL